MATSLHRVGTVSAPSRIACRSRLMPWPIRTAWTALSLTDSLACTHVSRVSISIFHLESHALHTANSTATRPPYPPADDVRFAVSPSPRLEACPTAASRSRGEPANATERVRARSPDMELAASTPQPTERPAAHPPPAHETAPRAARRVFTFLRRIAFGGEIGVPIVCVPPNATLVKRRRRCDNCSTITCSIAIAASGPPKTSTGVSPSGTTPSRSKPCAGTSIDPTGAMTAGAHRPTTGEPTRRGSAARARPAQRSARPRGCRGTEKPNSSRRSASQQQTRRRDLRRRPPPTARRETRGRLKRAIPPA